MNAIFVLILGFVVFYLGYRFYAGYVDSKIMQADPKRVTPAKMYMDGVEFMPTSRNILYGYQFKSIAGAGPIIGPIIAIQWGWLPAVVWILLGTLFIGWVHDYSSAMIAMRNDGASFGGLSHRLISPRARVILLAFIYFYLLLIVGAFGNVVVTTAGQVKGISHGVAVSDHWRCLGRADDLPLEDGHPCHHCGMRGYCDARDIPGQLCCRRTRFSARLFPKARRCGQSPRLCFVTLRRCCRSGGLLCPSTMSLRTSCSWACCSA